VCCHFSQCVASVPTLNVYWGSCAWAFHWLCTLRGTDPILPVYTHATCRLLLCVRWTCNWLQPQVLYQRSLLCLLLTCLYMIDRLAWDLHVRFYMCLTFIWTFALKSTSKRSSWSESNTTSRTGSGSSYWDI
jgi:hypothetical protein